MTTIKPVERHQADGKQDEYSLMTGLDCSESPDTARQEFKNDADVNKLLARYGVGPIPQRATVFQEVDYDLDLQTAMYSIEAAQRAYAKMPASLRDKYRDWRDVLNGIYTGQFKIDLAPARAAEREAKTTRTVPEYGDPQTPRSSENGVS